MNTKTVRSGWLERALLVGLVGACALGCSVGTGNDDDGAESIEGSIIGGVPVEAKEFDAVGALVFVSSPLDMGDSAETEPMKIMPFCSATLIEQSTVVTAQHCAERLTKRQLLEDSYWGWDVAFAIGPDARHPKKLVPVVAAAIEQTVTGGVLYMGADVAVAHLAGAVKDVTPIAWAPFPSSFAGTRFAIMGYGMRNQIMAYGKRHVGSTSVTATSGKVYEKMYGSYEKFKAELLQDWPDMADANRTLLSPNSAEAEAAYRRIYNETTLVSGYEALIGLKEGDAATCYGDSGGPLLYKTPSGLKVVGVTSWGGSSQYGMCNREDVSAIFGPAVRTFLTAELAGKTHPCDKIAYEGECDGDTVIKCTNHSDRGERRVSRVACGMLGNGFTCYRKPAPPAAEGEEETPLEQLTLEAIGPMCAVPPPPPAEPADGETPHP